MTQTATSSEIAKDYHFTFEKDIDLLIAKHQADRTDYDMVRIHRYVEANSQNTLDYPCKTREDLIYALEKFRDLIISIYPSKHFEEFEEEY